MRCPLCGREMAKADRYHDDLWQCPKHGKVDTFLLDVGNVAVLEDTECPNCGATAVKRVYYDVKTKRRTGTVTVNCGWCGYRFEYSRR